MSTREPRRVILIEDDVDVRHAIGQALELEGYKVDVYESAEGALDKISTKFAGILVTDIRLPGRDGRQIFRDARNVDAEIPVVLISGHGELQEAVDLMREGAYDFISKPFAAPRLLASVRNALEQRGLVLDNRRLQAQRRDATTVLPLIGDGERIVRLRSLLRELADTDIPILISGETGTGKEAVARVLHDQSRRKNQPFVIVDCAALPENILEAELFGTSSVVSGMTRRTPGRLELATRGTLFLDNIDNLTLTGQAKLLRAVADKHFGGAATPEAPGLQCRVLAASNRNLAALVASGEFRSDLFFRLNTVTLQLPPLRERREDIATLFLELLAGAATRLKRPTPLLTKPVKRYLLEHSWPGNIRELSHFADRIVLGLDAADPNDNAADQIREPLPDIVERFEASLIRDALRATGGNVKDCLGLLRIPRKTFYDKVARHHIDLDEFRTPRR